MSSLLCCASYAHAAFAVLHNTHIPHNVVLLLHHVHVFCTCHAVLAASQAAVVVQTSSIVFSTLGQGLLATLGGTLLLGAASPRLQVLAMADCLAPKYRERRKPKFEANDHTDIMPLRAEYAACERACPPPEW